MTRTLLCCDVVCIWTIWDHCEHLGIAESKTRLLGGCHFLFYSQLVQNKQFCCTLIIYNSIQQIIVIVDALFHRNVFWIGWSLPINFLPTSLVILTKTGRIYSCVFLIYSRIMDVDKKFKNSWR